MTNTYKTLNPLGSNNARDLSDNASNFDEYMNSDLPSIKDRFDKRRETLAGNQVAFDDAQEGRAQEFTDAQSERESEFNADQSERDAVFQTFLDGTGWSSIGAYGAGVVITSHTQTVDYLGQPYSLKPSIPASLDAPYTTTGVWATEGVNFKLVGDNSLRQELTGPDGAKLIPFKRRTVYDKLADVVCILDAPFNAIPDGTPQTAAFDAFHDYLATNGATGWYGPYPLNAGTHRFKRTVGVQAFKSFTVYGSSNLITLENIDPIYTPGAGQKGLANEPHLFDLRGNAAAKIPHPTVTFHDFGIDYSAQRFKGGSDETTPALTDIDPMSLGMKLFYSEYGRVVIERVTGNEVYGEFVQLNRSPWSIIRDNIANNVSAGNLGRADSSGAFAMLLRGSTTGTIVENNRAINKRVYMTDTIRGYADISAKGTPCGYIGICQEYGNDISGLPAVDYELWENANKPNADTLNGNVVGNTMYGYYIGYKAENDVVVNWRGNNAFCCWMPYVVSTRCQGKVSGNYADRGRLDNLNQPMAGFRYVQGMYCHLSYVEDHQIMPDVVFDGNNAYTRSIPVFTTNTNNSKFLNQMTTIDPLTGNTPDIVRHAATFPISGLEVSGSVLILNQLGRKTSSITDFIDGKFDLRVVNRSSFEYIARLNSFYAPVGKMRPKVNITAIGIVGVEFLNSTPNPFTGDFTLTDTAKAFASAEPGRFYTSNAAVGGDAKMTIRMHSSAVPNGYPVVAYGVGGEVTADYFIEDSGSNLVTTALRTGGMGGGGGTGFVCRTPTIRARVHEDAYSSPILSVFMRYASSLRVTEARGKGSLFAAGPTQGPIFLQDIECRAISTTGTTEPNTEANLKNSSTADGVTYYSQGSRFPFLRPSPSLNSGKEGTLVTGSGLKAAAWASSTAIAVGDFRKSGLNTYVASVAGTTGTVAPSHTSGSAVDGAVTWNYAGPAATFAMYGSIS